MSCGEVRERLELYADGALDAAESAALEAHLAACEACRAYRLVGDDIAAAVRREHIAAARARRARVRPLAAARRLLVGAAAAVAVVACATVGAEAYRLRKDSEVRTEALRAAESVLESILDRGLTRRDVGIREVRIPGGEGTATVRVSGGPDLFEVRVSVVPRGRAGGPAGAVPAEIVAIFGTTAEGRP